MIIILKLKKGIENIDNNYCRWGESVFSEKIKTTDLTMMSESGKSMNNKTIAKIMRKKFYYSHLEPLNVSFFS